MLQLLKDFLNEVGIGDKPVHHFDSNDDRLAAAALLIHVMTVDGKETPEELQKLHDLLKRQFNLDDDLTAELIEEATAADRESVDLYRFTSQLMRSLDEDGRKRIVKMMWQMVYADGALPGMWIVFADRRVLRRTRLLADFIVDEGGAHGGFHAEAFAQTARGVVLAAPFPGGERTGGADASFTGVETQHHFAEGDLIEGDGTSGLDGPGTAL